MTSWNDEKQSQVIVSTAWQDYEKLFDFDWAKLFFEKATGTAVESAAQTFALQWRGAGNTFRMPFILLTQMEVFAKAYTEEESSIYQYVQILKDGLVSRLQDQLSDSKQKQLQRAISSIAKEMPKKVSVNAFTRQEIWDEYMATTEMRFYLWSSQQQCFTTLYFAYENFLLKCVRERLNDPALKLFAHNAKDKISQAFDFGTYMHLWAHPQMERARICRHVLAHNGGEETNELKVIVPKFQTVNGVVQILPADNRWLFSELKDRAVYLADKFR